MNLQPESRSGQVIPDAATLTDYSYLFILTFDAYRSASVLSSNTRSIFDTCMSVVLISQDATYSGVPESWLDSWFSSGAIQGDVSGGTYPLTGSGFSSSFTLGWSGTALMENFGSVAGGASEGQWWQTICQETVVSAVTHTYSVLQVIYTAISSPLLNSRPALPLTLNLYVK